MDRLVPKFQKLCLCLCTVLGLTFIGCERGFRTSNEGIRYLLPWSTAPGRYEFVELPVNSLKNPLLLKGEAAHIYADTAFTTSGFWGPIAKPNVVRSGSLYIPTDALSTLAISAYVHFDHLMQLDKKLGVTSHLLWPRKAGVSIGILNSNREREQNNARYISAYDAIVISPDQSASVPMAINPGIIAHEHFHAHFYQAVTKRFKSAPMADDERSNYNQVVIRAWNEGLADFYAWVYSGNPDFISESLRRVGKYRRLDLEPEPLSDIGKLFKMVKEPKLFGCEDATCFAYAEGTQIARLLYKVTVQYVQSKELNYKKITLMKKILENLDSFGEEIYQRSQNNFIDPAQLIIYMFSQSRIAVDVDSCLALQKVLGQERFARSLSQRCQL